MSENDFKVQVTKDHYFVESYTNPEHFSSFANQIHEVVKLSPKSILEIGVGNGVFSAWLQKAGFAITTMDHAQILQPDIVSSVTDIQASDNEYDVVACFQVLEHLPYKMAEKGLQEVWRVTRRFAVISLPDSMRYLCINICVPKFGRRILLVNLPFLGSMFKGFNGEHYWEVNAPGFPLKRVEASMRKVGFEIINTYRHVLYPYHRFFVLEKQC